jgi:hypothetical protein
VTFAIAAACITPTPPGPQRPPKVRGGSSTHSAGISRCSLIDGSRTANAHVRQENRPTIRVSSDLVVHDRDAVEPADVIRFCEERLTRPPCSTIADAGSSTVP